MASAVLFERHLVERTVRWRMDATAKASSARRLCEGSNSGGASTRAERIVERVLGNADTDMMLSVTLAT